LTFENFCQDLALAPVSQKPAPQWFYAVKCNRALTFENFCQRQVLELERGRGVEKCQGDAFFFWPQLQCLWRLKKARVMSCDDAAIMFLMVP
jgi:hypothetical protein